MSRTQKRWLADQPIPDAQIFIGFVPGDVYSGSGAAATRTAAGNFGLSLPTAGTAYIIDRPIRELIFRTGMQDDLQEEFGGGATSQVFAAAQGLASPPASFTTPAGVSGPPPFTGVTQFTPVTAARPKGIQINSISCWYSISGAAATVNTIGIYQTVAANNVAPAITTLLTATTLSTAVQTNPYLTTVTLASPAMITAKNAEISFEWNLTTGASTGAAVIRGIIMQCSYNYQ